MQQKLVRQAERMLPLTHVTSWPAFIRIVRTGALLPRYSKVFRRDVLYLSYGDVAFRPSPKAYSWSDNFPIAIMFKPEQMAVVDRVYPFDTGAIAAGRFAGLQRGDDFRTGFDLSMRSIAATSWINFFYGSNRNYFERSVLVRRASLNDKFASLNETCLRYDQTRQDTGLDFRLISTLECHCHDAVSLKSNIRWLGAPAVLRHRVEELIGELGGPLPRVFYYSAEPERGNLPSDLIAASRAIVERYLVS